MPQKLLIHQTNNKQKKTKYEMKENKRIRQGRFNWIDLRNSQGFFGLFFVCMYVFVIFSPTIIFFIHSNLLQLMNNYKKELSIIISYQSKIAKQVRKRYFFLKTSLGESLCPISFQIFHFGFNLQEHTKHDHSINKTKLHKMHLLFLNQVSSDL